MSYFYEDSHYVLSHSLRSKYFPRLSVLEHLQPIFFNYATIDTLLLYERACTFSFAYIKSPVYIENVKLGDS
jgi:hypothetical protein